jgi:farnesyl diphosphate synthase
MDATGSSAAAQFEASFAREARAVEDMLAALLDDRIRDGEIRRPDRLLGAMRYAVLNGGKRLRPYLAIECARLIGGETVDRTAVLRVAAAIECVHCYSLVHDDLPAMDDDDLRRGLPTVHIAFDEATAILAGDSLLTFAFDILSASETELPPEVKIALVLALSRASGLGGMAGGQMLDLEAERERPDEAGVITLQAMKTGALIRMACEAGAIVAGGTSQDRERLARFGETIGLAFQLADDLLDLTADAEAMGKATGKDSARGKGTLVAMHGEDWARAQLRGLIAEAEELLSIYGEKNAALLEASRFVASRKR